jgi:hypothetical protein
MKYFLSALCLVISVSNSRAELQTLTLDNSVTNVSATIQITAQQSIEVKGVIGGVQGGSIIYNVNGLVMTNTIPGTYSSPTVPVVFAGPGSVQIVAATQLQAGQVAVTFDIEPSPFPPGRTLTLGAYSGNVTVTMQESTDLVNWTTAQNGATYTNSPSAAFFRIQMTQQ